MANLRQWLTLSTWTRVVPGIKDAFIRFPLPLICVIGASVVAALMLHDVKFASREIAGRLLVSLSYGAIALTSLKLFVESKSWSSGKHALAAFVVIAVVMAYTWFVFNSIQFSTSVYFVSALVISLLFAPYIKNNSDEPSVWYFNYQTGVAIFFAGMAALVLGLGMIIILSSLHYLFDIKIPPKIYGDIWILSWGVLFPIYVLANISRQFDFDAESCGFPKGIRFITNYILLPLMVVYIAILYAYFIRITVQGELPRGKLTWMIAGFGAVGVVTKLLAYPIRNSGTRLLAWFDRYFYYALVVPIIMLAIAIGVRIRDYGVTEQRYSVILMAVWFSSVTLLAMIRKHRFHIKYVPMILAVLVLLGSFGPWGAAEVSIRSQVSRFKTLLTKYQLLKDGQVVKTTTDIPFADRVRLSSSVTYLCRNEKRYKRIRPWFRTLLTEAGKKQDMPCISLDSVELVKLMGIEYANRWQRPDNYGRFEYNNKFFMINRDFVDVSGFDYVGHGSMYRYNNKASDDKYEIEYKTKHRTVIVHYDGKRMTVKTETGDMVSFDIGGLIRDYRKRHVVTLTQADRKKLSFEATSTSGRLKVRLILERIVGTVTKKQEMHVLDLQYYLMLKFNDS